MLVIVHVPDTCVGYDMTAEYSGLYLVNKTTLTHNSIRNSTCFINA